MKYLTEQPIDSRSLAEGVMRPSDGACIVFEGVVRNHHEGHAVESIFYDAYREMAEKEIAAVIHRVSASFPDVSVAVLHRLGHLQVGETSIAIVCTAAHRAEAFAAARAVIDQIKESVPIWKKERGPDGEEWVGWQSKC
ncbi:MAG TPA: molybdenum cofactor biosynthesis protein MoaE [Thermoanaerobaculia bacterium]|nr:molybdenum cofactor biosynthesis protein MoaE [Thermoanaerobaculia bacterium]